MKVVFLSHRLSLDTPGYGGAKAYSIEKTRSICMGDTSNNSTVTLSTHVGTHVDFPYHFSSEGKKCEDYPADYFIFNKILLVEVEPDQLIIEDELISVIDENKNSNPELLLIKTGFSINRGKKKYWEQGYGLSPSLATYLRESFSNLRMVGFDFISLTSYQHRELGREAHKEFLLDSRPLLILEDMNLDVVGKSSSFNQVVVSPLIIEGADGSPVTVFGELND